MDSLNNDILNNDMSTSENNLSQPDYFNQNQAMSDSQMFSNFNQPQAEYQTPQSQYQNSELPTI